MSLHPPALLIPTMGASVTSWSSSWTRKPEGTEAQDPSKCSSRCSSLVSSRGQGAGGLEDGDRRRGRAGVPLEKGARRRLRLS